MGKIDAISKSTNEKLTAAYAFLSVLYLVFLASSLWGLHFHTYEVRQSDLVILNNIKMLERAYEDGGNRSSNRSIRFTDETSKTFIIDGERFHLVEHSDLMEKLMFSGAIMQIWTDDKGARNYLDPTNNEKIRVYRIRIDGKDYLNLEALNKRERQSKVVTLLAMSIFYLVFSLVYIFRKRFSFES